MLEQLYFLEKMLQKFRTYSGSQTACIQVENKLCSYIKIERGVYSPRIYSSSIERLS